MKTTAPKDTLRLVLQVTAEQSLKLEALQAAFAEVCNALAPRVQQTRCWNRVTLHHLTYRELREQFPHLGSQMTCNAIYSVCKAARAIFQDARSPFNLQKRPGKALPLLRFSEGSPVYFDRHTLSIRGEELSLFTLDGRMRFRIPEAAQARVAIQDRKLREVALTRGADGRFELRITFAQLQDSGRAAAPAPRQASSGGDALPDYVRVETTA